MGKKPSPLLLFLPAGIGLFFLLQWLEPVLQGGTAVNAALEEAGKLALFALAIPLLHPARDERPAEIFPFFGVCLFGIVENVVYFLRYPTTAVYLRLVYAYPVHVNTGLAFLLVFALRRWWLVPPVFLFSVAYHFAVNNFSTAGTEVICVAVAVNLLVFLLLYRGLRNRLVFARD